MAVELPHISGGQGGNLIFYPQFILIHSGQPSIKLREINDSRVGQGDSSSLDVWSSRDQLSPSQQLLLQEIFQTTNHKTVKN